MHQLRDVLKKYWGYDTFRPLQAEAMECVLSGRDSVVVLPTGGGKSLCYQAPALCLPGLAVVVSPLISLMKDQVDALTGCGVPAACVNSSHSAEERRQVADEVRSGRLKLLYVSPERLVTDRMLEFLHGIQLSFVAIDEAHCISDWGHDFRPEYRGLQVLKETFPGLSVHAYTATATEQVRSDIAHQLHLHEPTVLVGSFDRPNLIYRVQQRTEQLRQVCEVLERHRNESGIIYCIRRQDVDDLCAALNELGYRARPYHAGMTDPDRQRNQEAFIQEEVEIIVATVAFGMGIDKSNVRYVVHTGAPKSLENYQQESGRAGRDGLEAECCLFYSAVDFLTWRRLQGGLEPRAHQIAVQKLAGIEGFCTGAVCRHRALVEYFGQQFEAEGCGGCDVCLAELDLVEDSLVIAQKILSCVVRLGQNFGADYTALVLSGSREQRILERKHDQLSTWGILSSENKSNIRNWIEQLVGQGYLHKSGEYHVLQLTPAARQVLRGEVVPRLLKPSVRPKKESKAAAHSWEGVDRGLFEVLRGLRRQKAEQQGVPAFIIFSDATLRDMARRRPSTREGLRQVSGIGEKKNAEHGAEFLEVITQYCRENSVEMDVAPGGGLRSSSAPVIKSDGSLPAKSKRQAWELFQQGCSVEAVMEQVGRARTTVMDYLAEFIQREEISDISPWLEESVYHRVREAAVRVGIERLKPIFEALEGTVGYDQIRLALAALRNLPPESFPALDPPVSPISPSEAE